MNNLVVRGMATDNVLVTGGLGTGQGIVEQVLDAIRRTQFMTMLGRYRR